MLSPTIISPLPVEIPLAVLPERFRPPVGSDFIVLDGAGLKGLSSLRFRVTRSSGDAAIVEAWVPFEGDSPAKHSGYGCYLTREAVEYLGRS